MFWGLEGEDEWERVGVRWNWNLRPTNQCEYSRLAAFIVGNSLCGEIFWILWLFLLNSRSCIADSTQHSRSPIRPGIWPNALSESCLGVQPPSSLPRGIKFSDSTGCHLRFPLLNYSRIITTSAAIPPGRNAPRTKCSRSLTLLMPPRLVLLYFHCAKP